MIISFFKLDKLIKIIVNGKSAREAPATEERVILQKFR